MSLCASMSPTIRLNSPSPSKRTKALDVSTPSTLSTPVISCDERILKVGQSKECLRESVEQKRLPRLPAVTQIMRNLQVQGKTSRWYRTSHLFQLQRQTEHHVQVSIVRRRYCVQLLLLTSWHWKSRMYCHSTVRIYEEVQVLVTNFQETEHVCYLTSWFELKKESLSKLLCITEWLTVSLEESPWNGKSDCHRRGDRQLLSYWLSHAEDTSKATSRVAKNRKQELKF